MVDKIHIYVGKFYTDLILMYFDLKSYLKNNYKYQMTLFTIFIVIVIVMVVLCIVSKCFENSYMSRVRNIQEQPEDNELDFNIKGVPLT